MKRNAVERICLQHGLLSGAGANSFWINARYMAACGIDPTDTVQAKKMVKKSEFNNGIETVFYKASVPELCLQGDTSIRVQQFDATFTSSLIYDGKVSIDWLGNQLTFDLAHKKMIVATR